MRQERLLKRQVDNIEARDKYYNSRNRYELYLTEDPKFILFDNDKMTETTYVPKPRYNPKSITEFEECFQNGCIKWTLPHAMTLGKRDYNWQKDSPANKFLTKEDPDVAWAEFKLHKYNNSCGRLLSYGESKKSTWIEFDETGNQGLFEEYLRWPQWRDCGDFDESEWTCWAGTGIEHTNYELFDFDKREEFVNQIISSPYYTGEPIVMITSAPNQAKFKKWEILSLRETEKRLKETAAMKNPDVHLQMNVYYEDNNPYNDHKTGLLVLSYSNGDKLSVKAGIDKKTEESKSFDCGSNHDGVMWTIQQYKRVWATKLAPFLNGTAEKNSLNNSESNSK